MQSSHCNGPPPAYKKALIAQTSCGIEDLRKFLECEIDLIWATQTNCTEDLRYKYTLLGLIEAAQIFSRNQIDTATRIAASKSEERYTAFNTRRASAERDSSGRSCSWATATSAQYFNRDSQDNVVGFSESNSIATEAWNENGFDKGTRFSSGYGFSFSNTSSSQTGRHGMAAAGPGEAWGTDITINVRETDVHGGTSPYVQPTGIHYDEFELSGDFPFINWPTVQGQFLNLGGAVNSDQICREFVINDPLGNCPRPDFPSAGQGYNGRYKVSVAVPLIGEISFDFARGLNQRQYYHCQRSDTRGTQSRNMLDRDVVTGATDGNDRSFRTEQGTITNLVRKYGSSVRRGDSATDVEEQSRGRANGIAHSESERQSTANAYQQSRAESQGKSHAESHLRKTEWATDDYVANKYGQIAQQLAQLWDRIWSDVQRIEKELAASSPVGGRIRCNCKRECKCNGVRVSYHGMKDAHIGF